MPDFLVLFPKVLGVEVIGVEVIVIIITVPGTPLVPL